MLHRAVLRCPARAAVARPAALRSFHQTVSARAMGESDVHKEQRASEIESHKQDQLKKQKEGKAEWKRELASDSEAAVKADQSEATGSKADIEKLQKETEKMAEKK